jgi:adenosine deaminase
VDGQQCFEVEAVDAWLDAQDPEPDAAAAGADPASPTPAPRDPARQADMVRKVNQARRSGLELAAVRALRDLGLDVKIRACKSFEDFTAIDLEVAALLANGTLSPDRARAIEGSIANARQNTKAHRDAGDGQDDLERFALASDEALRIVEAFEGIVSDERRQKIVEHVLAEDAARENVRLMEMRYSPMLHTRRGLRLTTVVEAVLAGLWAARDAYGIESNVIVCGIRNISPESSLEMAELAVAWRERGVVGFDIAGEEAGHPAKAHLEAFHYCRRENFSITIHAGEAFGPPSIWQALQYCGAHRIGHGVRLVEDMAIRDGEVVKLGPLASYVRDKRIPLEVCPSSNVDTGAVGTLAEHPIRHFIAQHFRVTVNTDNRLMSGVTLSEEFQRLSRTLGLGLNDVERLTINAMKSAFADYDARVALIYGKLKPGFARLRGEPALAASLPPTA